MQTITRENVYVSEEFRKCSLLYDQLKKAYDESINKEKTMQQVCRAMELEKEDILKTYRNAC